MIFWLEKSDKFFVYVKKKKFLEKKNLDLCLLNKTKSFGFKKNQIYFQKTTKLVLNLYVKKIKSF